MVILLGEAGGCGPAFAQGKVQVPLEWKGAVETPEGREGLCGGAGSGALSVPGALHGVCGFGMEASLQGGQGKARGGRSLLARVYFCRECFWIPSRAGVREEAATGHQAFGWGLWRSSEPCLAGLSHQCFPSSFGLGSRPRGCGAPGVRRTVTTRAWCQRRGGPWCSRGLRFDLSDLWRLICSLPSPFPPPHPIPPHPRFGSRTAGPNGESGSATSKPSCARTASGRSSTGSCSPTTTCTRATRTTTGRPRASRPPRCPPRASPSSTR